MSLLGLAGSSHVHLSLSFHLLIKLIYLMDQILVDLFDLVLGDDWGLAFRSGFLFRKHFIDPLPDFIDLLRVSVLAPLRYHIVQQVGQFL